jgi:hypothetical protein
MVEPLVLQPESFFILEPAQTSPAGSAWQADSRLNTVPTRTSHQRP